jgi:RHS repeat-associated protein
VGPGGTRPRSCSDTSLNPVNYTGGTRDTTGLTKLGTWYYNPAVGRFTQPDPSGQDATYAYGGDTPTSTDDPSGRLYEFLHGRVNVIYSDHWIPLLHHFSE